MYRRLAARRRHEREVQDRRRSAHPLPCGRSLRCETPCRLSTVHSAVNHRQCGCWARASVPRQSSASSSAVPLAGWNDLEGGLRASFCTFPSTILETLRNDRVVDVNNAIRIELVYFWTDLGTNPVAAACRLIDYHL